MSMPCQVNTYKRPGSLINHSPNSCTIAKCTRFVCWNTALQMRLWPDMVDISSDGIWTISISCKRNSRIFQQPRNHLYVSIPKCVCIVLILHDMWIYGRYSRYFNNKYWHTYDPILAIGILSASRHWCSCSLLND